MLRFFLGKEEDCMSEEAQDLIMKLLKKNPKDRPDIKEIKGHKFFQGIPWKYLRQMPAPFKPEINDELYTGNFRQNRVTDEDKKPSNKRSNIIVGDSFTWKSTEILAQKNKEAVEKIEKEAREKHLLKFARKSASFQLAKHKPLEDEDEIEEHKDYS
jgi:serine/threonine protein kinase